MSTRTPDARLPDVTGQTPSGARLLVFDECLDERVPPSSRAGMHLWLFDLAANVTDDICPDQVLDRDERERAARFVFARHRERFVRRRVLARLVLARYLDCSPDSVRFEVDHLGKPRVVSPGASWDVQFSASSSEDVACLAVAAGRLVGVDVEVPTATKREAWRSVAKTAFRPDEVTGLSGLPAEQAAAGFFRLWTLKEAYLKALGTGLQGLARSPCLFACAEAGGQTHSLAHEGTEWLCRSLALSCGAVVSLVLGR